MCRALHLSTIALLLAGCPGSAKLPPDTGGGIDLTIIQLEDGGTKDTTQDGPLDGPADDGVAPKDTRVDSTPKVDTRVDTRVDGSPGDSTVDLAPCGGGCPLGQDCVANSCQCIVGGSCNGCCQNNSCVFVSSQSMSTCGTGGSACTNCPSSRSDRCTSGVCRCGTSAPCGPGLNCVNGACKCIENGRCDGCCANDTTCVTTLTAAQCGADGDTCATCAGDIADSCNTNGTCRCGSSPACGPGLNCVSGSCQCIQDGRCGGCCENNVCYDSVTVLHCGEDGSACFACPTDRASHCLNGSCSCHDGFGPARPACPVGEICVPNGSGFFICELIQ